MSESVEELRARLASAPVTARHKDRAWVTIDIRDLVAIDALLARLATAEAAIDTMVESVRHSAGCHIYGIDDRCTCDYVASRTAYDDYYAATQREQP